MTLLNRGIIKHIGGVVFKATALQTIEVVLKILGSSYYLQTHLEPILYIPLYGHMADR